MRKRMSAFLSAAAAVFFFSCGPVFANEVMAADGFFGPMPQLSEGSAADTREETKESAPSSLTISLTNEAAGIQLSWKSTDSASPYTVFRKMEDEDSWTRLCDTEETTYTDTSCINGFLYRYVVLENFAASPYQFSEEVSLHPELGIGNPACFLKVPSLYGAVSSLPGALTVNWGMNEMVDGYQISLSDGETLRQWEVPGVSSLIETIQDLQEGAPYSIQLRGYKTIKDVTYYSAWSDAETVTVQQAIESAQGYSPIMGTSAATAEQMQAYLKMVNPSVSQSVLDMIPYYLSEGMAEGIRGDIAFAQSCLETGNFNFAGSAVTLNQNNFCGLGVTSNGMQGNSFETPQLGIRAQIQHLKAYCSTDPLKNTCIDPRFEYVDRASAVYVEWLGIQENPKHTGWASGGDYGEKILAILNRILEMEVS